MKQLITFCALAIIASAGIAQAGVATYADFSGSVIRNGASGGYTTNVTSDNTDETFTVTAVGGGKVAIGTSATNGLKVSDYVNFKFSNSVSGVSGGSIVYPNFWVTDKNGHHAFVAMHYTVGGVQNDDPVYNEMTSAGGMSKSFFDDLGVRVYATDTSDLDWLYAGCVQKAKFGGWSTSLWKSADDGTFDPVKISDLGNLYFGSPFSSATVPGISGNPEWTYAGTGDPQMPESFYLMCGDTSGSVENKNYVLGDLELTCVPEPAAVVMLFLGLGTLLCGAGRRRCGK